MKKIAIILLGLIAMITVLTLVSCNRVIYPSANTNGPTVTVGNGKVHVAERIYFKKDELKQFFDSLMAGAQYHTDVFDIGTSQDTVGVYLNLGLTFQTK